MTREDNSPMKGKGKQFVPHGGRVKLEFPGGAGYGNAFDRDPKLVKRDFARGYISAASAIRDYGLSDEDIHAIEKSIENGEV